MKINTFLSQAFLHHIFVALILAVLQLLFYKLFEGWGFRHVHLLILLLISHFLASMGRGSSKT